MRVFVVMANDFPDSVYLDEGEAERYAKAETEKSRERPDYLPRIYYRVYPFEVMGAS